jgi:hypothetical protein
MFNSAPLISYEYFERTVYAFASLAIGSHASQVLRFFRFSASLKALLNTILSILPGKDSHRTPPTALYCVTHSYLIHSMQEYGRSPLS